MKKYESRDIARNGISFWAIGYSKQLVRKVRCPKTFGFRDLHVCVAIRSPMSQFRYALKHWNVMTGLKK